MENLLCAQRDALVDLLVATRGPKELVLDPQLVTMLNSVCGFRFLTDRGVTRIFPLEATVHGTPSVARVYIVRGTPRNLRLIAGHVNADTVASRQPTAYHVLVAPGVDALCALVLEEEGVLGLVQLHSLPLELVPVDVDVLSMQLPLTYKELRVHGDVQSLLPVAAMLRRLQSACGRAARVIGCGEAAVQVMQLLDDLSGNELDAEADDAVPSGLASIVLVDRAVDLVSCLATQLTYAGLVDELFGFYSIDGGYVNFGLGLDDKGSKVCLSTDPVFQTIKDANFSEVGRLLKTKALELGESYDERHAAVDLKELRKFVSKLGGLQSEHKALRIHTYAAEFIMKERSNDHLTRLLEAELEWVSHKDSPETLEWLESQIHRQKAIIPVLRLMCLYSTVHSGLKPKVHARLKQLFLHSYGFEQFLTLSNLESAGLFCIKAEGAKTYHQMQKKLFAASSDGKDARVSTQVFYGHAPLSTSIIEHLTFVSTPDLAQQLGQPVKVTTVPTTVAATAYTLVFFVGGVTCAEATALRTLFHRRNQSLLVGATSLLNGNSLVESMTFL